LREENAIQDVEEIQDNLTLLRAYVAFHAGDFYNAIQQGTLLLQKQGSMRTSLRERVYLAMGEFYLVGGEFEKSIPLLREAIGLARQMQNLVLFTKSTFRLGGALKTKGLLVEAEKGYWENLKILRDSGLGDSSLMGRPEIGLGDILREKGNLVAAEKMLADGIKHLQLFEAPYDLVLAYIYLSRLENERGNIPQALALIEQADQLFQVYTIPPTFRSIWEYYRVSAWIANANWDQIERWMAEQQRKPDIPLSFARELILMAISRVHIAQGKYNDALNLLVPLAQDVEAEGHCGRLIEILNLLAVALYKKGNTNEALAYLRKSLTIAEPEGYLRIFLDEGEPMIDLLKQLRNLVSATYSKVYVNQLLEAYLLT
jgi:LuxR family maltose regulon positive regulatory protein